MHEIAEEGVAAHWKYKDKKAKSKMKNFMRMQKIDRFSSKKMDEKEQRDLLRKLLEMLNRQYFVFTPKDDVVEMPRNSTALDFAFQVHTQIGYRTIGVKVNGRITQLNQVLKNGDKVRNYDF